jgi:hypothetical protein
MSTMRSSTLWTSDGIEHDPFCADGIDRITKPDKKSFQVECAAFLVFAPLDLNLIDEQLFLSDKTRKIVAKGRDVLGNVLGALLEGDEDAWLAESQRAFRQVSKERRHCSECDHALKLSPAREGEGAPAPWIPQREAMTTLRGFRALSKSSTRTGRT